MKTYAVVSAVPVRERDGRSVLILGGLVGSRGPSAGDRDNHGASVWAAGGPCS
jgi:hypothetical protein